MHFRPVDVDERGPRALDGRLKRVLRDGSATGNDLRLNAGRNEDAVAVKPGQLRSIKERDDHAFLIQATHKPSNQQPATIENGRREKLTERRRKTKDALAPEPINYLRLRRTEESKQALLRNRANPVVINEILHPSSPTKEVPSRYAIVVEEAAALTNEMERQLEEMQKRVFARVETQQEDGAAVLAVQLQQLYREQAVLQKESNRASQQVQTLLTAVRNEISVMYKFTPLFKIYSHHKLKSAWHHWMVYNQWRRDEEARIALLWPFAVQIQRVFRRKRSQWERARTRLGLAWERWLASVTIQRWMRQVLSRREYQYRIEAKYATLVQAAWRGSCERKRVKKMLKAQLRWMLRSLSPTGNLHRLHEVSRKQPQLAATLNAILTLVEETNVAVDANSVYKAKNARVAARNAARPVEATRKQLFHAIFNLQTVIRRRDRAIEAAKRTYSDKMEAKQRAMQLKDTESKAKELQKTKENISIKLECEKMAKEELETKDYERMLRTVESDRILRVRLAQRRKEEAENARMVVEEYQMRYYVSEVRRRNEEVEKRRQEVEKRYQALMEQEQAQMNQVLEMLKTDEMKRNEAEEKRQRVRLQEHELWEKLSREQQSEAVRRLQLKDELKAEEIRRGEARLRVQEEQDRERFLRLERSRKQRQEELDSELRAREAMDQEEKLRRKVHFALKKAKQTAEWQTKREKETTRYSLDPMHFSKIQQLKEIEERERRERYLMKREDTIADQVREKERKERYFQECRLRKKQQQEEVRRAQRECAMMGAEERVEQERRAIIRREHEYKKSLAEMARLAELDKLKEAQRLAEARNRKTMYDEELRHRRVEQMIQQIAAAREQRETDLMVEEDRLQREILSQVIKAEKKRQRGKRIFQMMKEDVQSMSRQDWEDEGSRLEELLWDPADIAAFRHCVAQYPLFLITNVRIFRELSGALGDPPFDLNYEAVYANRSIESRMSVDNVPRKRRKPRKFFYHEFFEEDPILSALKPAPAPPSTARLRWKKLADHFLSSSWNSEAVRQGYILMRDGEFKQACCSFLLAVHSDSNATRKPSAGLLRQTARCCLKQWEVSFDRAWLDKSLFYYHRASAHVTLLTNPAFLQEVALALEKKGGYRDAAEVISGIIRCFPRYSKMTEVIFRGGMIMFSLQMYQQSREYLLHTLDAAPFGWEPADILFLVARILHLEGKMRRKMCSVAYEESFRTNKRDAFYRNYPTWREWIKDCSTWRQFGDRYFQKQEFSLARDAYQVMMKRQLKKPAHLMTKRELALNVRAMKVQKQSRVEDSTVGKPDDLDWLRIARCHAILNDRVSTETALKRWFGKQPYLERVIERFYTWPLARWKLLGVEIPEQVMEALERKKQELQEAEALKRKAMEDQRLQILRQRSLKARGRMVAWADDTTQSNSPVESSVSDQATTANTHHREAESVAPDRVDPWVKVTDEASQDFYFWNEETGDVVWDLPSDTGT
ncbi:hypothetical protein Poli38472_006026 [Pythium oligandrum]|uniref:WW domain-containing protein n=1 Tax=Pythium oligandrum TaxID=41045 RepID=A0A8K1CUM2_PYTOL|nr:hypothetical protein Poli38472_006026 [Pythium oligandrum]|eukprot:TMW68558.1 hypothetical protein Poli38472_006026 [Pythium oligandrum]